MTLATHSDGRKVPEKRVVFSRLPLKLMYSRISNWLSKNEKTTAETSKSTTPSPVGSRFHLVLGSFQRMDDLTSRKPNQNMSIKLRSVQTVPRWVSQLCSWKFENATQRPAALNSICQSHD